MSCQAKSLLSVYYYGVGARVLLVGAPHTYLDMVFASYVMVDGVAAWNKYVLEALKASHFAQVRYLMCEERVKTARGWVDICCWRC